jgi:ribosomal protein L12E/L44/L45/RPP1/RPP2
MEKPVAPSESAAAAHLKSVTSAPRQKGRPAVSENSENVEAEETIDSVLSSLFGEGDKK